MNFKEGLKEAWKSKQGVYFTMGLLFLPTYIFGPETFYGPMPEEPAKTTIVRQVERAENRITYWKNDPKIDSAIFAGAERTLDSLLNTTEYRLAKQKHEAKTKEYEAQSAEWEKNAVNYYNVDLVYLIGVVWFSIRRARKFMLRDIEKKQKKKDLFK